MLKLIQPEAPKTNQFLHNLSVYEPTAQNQHALIGFTAKLTALHKAIILIAVLLLFSTLY
jgi:hypothetical protein